MKTLVKKLLLLLVILSGTAFLSACQANAQIHVTMDTKGNSQVEYQVLFDSPVADNPEYQQLVQSFRDKQYDVKDVKADGMEGFQATRAYRANEDFAEIFALNGEHIKRKSFLPEIQVKRDFLYTHASFNTDLGDIIKDCEARYPGAKVNIKLMLTTPFSVERINTPNADRDTHIWNIDRISENNVYADLLYFNENSKWFLVLLIVGPVVLYLLINRLIRNIVNKYKLR